MEENIEIVKPNRSHSTYNQPNSNLIYKIILAVIVLLIVAGASFASGLTYQKDHTANASASSSLTRTSGGGSFGFGGSGFSGSRGNRTFGSVSAISSTSITVQPSFGSSTAKTYAITSSTIITEDGQPTTPSSIAVGNTVIVSASTTNSADAAAIILSPGFGGQGSGSSTSTSTPSQAL